MIWGGGPFRAMAPPWVGKAGRGGGLEDSNCNPRMTQYSIQLCRPIPEAWAAPSGTHLVAWQASNTSPSLSPPIQAQTQGSLLLQPMAFIWAELKVITQSAATCEFKLFNWEWGRYK